MPLVQYARHIQTAAPDLQPPPITLTLTSVLSLLAILHILWLLWPRRRWQPIAWRLTTRWTSLVLQLYTPTLCQRNYILSILEGLREVADGANNIFIGVDAERENGHKAECEPRVALDDSPRPVSAVVALAQDALVALKLGGEFCNRQLAFWVVCDGAFEMGAKLTMFT